MPLRNSSRKGRTPADTDVDLTGDSPQMTTRSGTRNARNQAHNTPQPLGGPQNKTVVGSKGGAPDKGGETAYMTTREGARKAAAQAAATPQPMAPPQVNIGAQPKAGTQKDTGESAYMTTRRGTRNAAAQASGTPQETGGPAANAAAPPKINLPGGASKGVISRKTAANTVTNSNDGRAPLLGEKSKGKAKVEIGPKSVPQIAVGGVEQMSTGGASKNTVIDRRAPIIGEKSRGKRKMEVEPPSGPQATIGLLERMTTRGALRNSLNEEQTPIIAQKPKGKARMEVEPDTGPQTTPGTSKRMTTRKAPAQQPEERDQPMQVCLKPTLVGPARNIAPATTRAPPATTRTPPTATRAPPAATRAPPATTRAPPAATRTPATKRAPTATSSRAQNSKPVLGAISLKALPSDVKDEDHGVLARIREGIHYTSRLAPKQPPAVITHFTLPMNPQTTALRLLREASNKGLATFVWGSDREECYALGMPSALHSEPFPSGLSAQWWVGKTPAQIKAGPFATLTEVLAAQSGIDQKLKRQKSGLRWKAEEQNLDEGLLRQEAGEPMFQENADGDEGDKHEEE
ncbi:hypothetical protein K491DRAFT_720603 [Lophiostoma macrostomum CBS 122681]|uniref:Uncharacterized protein n=1 Tax=Lophiostoma macrostomum CBS 122681 TaxID=1314788 RepID=A0A6A6SSU1_9PLEO|nr:hypothetical protein K491DRAFT_720603 [Lophiostoma macrostomum CBS 122681]